MLTRAWAYLNGLDEETRERIHKAERHFKRRLFAKYVPTIFDEWNAYRLHVQDKRQKTAMAFIHHTNRKIGTSFFQFKAFVRKMRKLRRMQAYLHQSIMEKKRHRYFN